MQNEKKYVILLLLFDTGHQAYEPGTDAFQRLVDDFGHQIVGENGTINRSILGRIVFTDKVQYEKNIKAFIIYCCPTQRKPLLLSM